MSADYFRRYADFVLNYRPDIIAHFDLVRKFNQRFDFFDEDDPRYYRPALDALAQMAKTNAVLGLNTGVIARGWRTDPYPSPRLLTRWRELGGRTIIGGDCHDAAFIDCSFDLCVRMLLDAASPKSGASEPATNSLSRFRFLDLIQKMIPAALPSRRRSFVMQFPSKGGWGCFFGRHISGLLSWGAGAAALAFVKRREAAFRG
jgi:hypothetical protein